jgi:DNA-binding response OmpR family regulator
MPDEGLHRRMVSASGAARVPVVAVINTSQEITDLLQAVFQIDGFKVVTGFSLDIKRGLLDFDAFVEQHRPDAVIWDIAIPYEANWALFQEIAASPTGQRCRFVLTSTNVRALQALVGEVPVQELIGKPYDLDDLIRAVRRAIGDDRAAQPSDRDHSASDRIT